MIMFTVWQNLAVTREMWYFGNAVEEIEKQKEERRKKNLNLLISMGFPQFVVSTFLFFISMKLFWIVWYFMMRREKCEQVLKLTDSVDVAIEWLMSNEQNASTTPSTRNSLSLAFSDCDCDFDCDCVCILSNF
jgi:hypothetical protein